MTSRHDDLYDLPDAGYHPMAPDAPDTPNPHDAPPSRPAKRPGRKGSVTSVMGLLVLLAGITVTVTSVILRPDTHAGWVIQSGVATGIILVLSLIATLLGLRSASKPKGHVGRGRGLVTVICASVLPLVSFAITSALAYQMAQSVMHSGIVMHVIDRETGTSSLVTPVGSKPLTEREEQVLQALGLMPEVTVYDDEEVPVEASDGTLTVGETTVPSNSKISESLTEGVKKAQAQGYKVSIGADGRIHGTDADGNDVTITITRDGVNIQTESNLGFEELLARGSEMLTDRK